MVSEAVHDFVVGFLLPIYDAAEPHLGSGPAFVAVSLVPILAVMGLALIAHKLDGEDSPWR